MRNLMIATSLMIASVASASATNNECLIVRSAEGHRFRNSMIAGALTGGIGFAAGAAFGGAKYEYVDSFNLQNTKLKYKGGELQKLQQNGTHVVVINKKATSDETKSARESCAAGSAPTVVPASYPAQNSGSAQSQSAGASDTPDPQKQQQPE